MESCTGGTGGSDYCKCQWCLGSVSGWFVTYANEAKEKELGGERAETLQTYGAVSEKTAKRWQLGVLPMQRAQVGISTTGIGTGRRHRREAGLVYIGCAVRSNVLCRKKCFLRRPPAGSQTGRRPGDWIHTGMYKKGECLRMRKKIALMLLFVFVLTGCGRRTVDRWRPKHRQTDPYRDFTVYSVDTDKLSLIPVQVRKKANEVCTAKQIVTLVCDNLAVKVKVQSVEEKEGYGDRFFAPDSEPVKDCSEADGTDDPGMFCKQSAG